MITPELRETILQRHAIGVPAARLARQFGIGKTTVFRILAKAKEQQ
ncbi:helix-turn-helix domain-containing protein [Salmonella enterica]